LSFLGERGSNTICVAQVFLLCQCKFFEVRVYLGLHFAFLKHKSEEVVFAEVAARLSSLGILDRHVQLRRKLVEARLTQELLLREHVPRGLRSYVVNKFVLHVVEVDLTQFAFELQVANVLELGGAE